MCFLYFVVLNKVLFSLIHIHSLSLDFSLDGPGKILNDDVPLKEYKIDEKNFVVVMVTKVRGIQCNNQCL